MEQAIKLLRELEAGKFYGSLELKFEAGIVVLIRKTETFKPTEPGYGNSRSNHERNQYR